LKGQKFGWPMEYLDQHQVIFCKFIPFTGFILMKEFFWYTLYTRHNEKSYNVLFHWVSENKQGAAETLLTDFDFEFAHVKFNVFAGIFVNST
jgi:hypothetical protein